MVQLTRSAILLAICIHVGAREMSAQDPHPSRTSFVIGATGATMVAPRETDHVLALGVTAGFERQLSSALTVRAVTTAMRGGLGAGDNISICIIGPNDACLPRSFMPRWLLSGEFTASMALIPRFPLRLLGGFGFGVLGDAREPWKGSPSTDSGVETPRVLRAGLELPIGSSPRSPRLMLTRAWFAPRPFALRRLDGLAILFPR